MHHSYIVLSGKGKNDISTNVRNEPNRRCPFLGRIIVRMPMSLLLHHAYLVITETILVYIPE